MMNLLFLCNVNSSVDSKIRITERGSVNCLEVVDDHVHHHPERNVASLSRFYGYFNGKNLQKTDIIFYSFRHSQLGCTLLRTNVDSSSSHFLKVVSFRQEIGTDPRENTFPITTILISSNRGLTLSHHTS